MIIGYARENISGQNLDKQKAELSGSGCEKVYIDVIYGDKSSRPELTRALESLQPGDTFTVTSLDR